MKLYRAVPRKDVVPGKPINRFDSRRLPVNVSYLADNLWEFTRPAGRPSRRHAVYASPTPELALMNASAGGLSRADYIVCSLEFRHEPAIFQLSVSDAREHPDIGRLQRLVNGELTARAGQDAASKLALAPLFMPGVTRDEMASAMECSSLLRDMVHKAAGIVTMWRDDAIPEGELFFEIAQDNAFILHPA